MSTCYGELVEAAAEREKADEREKLVAGHRRPYTARSIEFFSEVESPVRGLLDSGPVREEAKAIPLAELSLIELQPGLKKEERIASLDKTKLMASIFKILSNLDL